MIIGLHHAQITIPTGQEDEARDFYCEVLGLEEIEKPNSLKGRGGFWLRLGHQELHVGTEEGVDRTKTKAHIAYQVDDITYWKKRLEDNGLEILNSIPIPNCERFECRDPFGNRLEMIQVIAE